MMDSYEALAGLTPSQNALGLGRGTHVWSEQTGASNIDKQL